MKRKLLLAGLALASALGMRAQTTDVTSTYITNPSFELGKTGEAFTSAVAGAFDAPYSWTTDANFPTSGTHDFGIYTAAENSTPSAFGKTVTPADGTYYYLGRHSWSSSLVTALTQTSKAALPAGTYMLEIAYKLGTNTSNGATEGTLKLGVKQSGASLGEVSSEKTVSAGGTYFNTASWSRMSVPFTVSSAGTTDFIITFNFNPTAKNSPQEAIIIDDVRLYSLNTASANNGIDVSGFVKNNNFNASTEGWTSTTGASSNKLASNKSGAITGNFYENWKNSPYTGKISQTLSGIPNGVYKLTAASFFNQAGTYADHVKVFANADAEFVTAAETPELYTVFTDVTDNILEIGVNKISKDGESGDNWMGIDNVSLFYYGDDATVNDVKLAGSVAAYREAKERAEAFTSASMFSAAWTTLQSAISSNTLDLNDGTLTEDAINTATENLNAASDAADVAVRKQTVYNTAVTIINGGTNVDLTSLIANPSFEVAGLSGWTNTSAETQTNKSFDNLQGDIYTQRWHYAGAVDINQTIEELPAGVYQVSAYSYFSETGARVYANSTEVAVTTSGKYSVFVEIGDRGSITIGAGCTSTSTSWWCVDGFELTYLGQVSELEYTLATGKIAADKVSAQASAETTFLGNKTIANYNALIAAISNAEASKAVYANLKANIDKANDIKDLTNFVTASGVTTFASAIAHAQDLYDTPTTDSDANDEVTALGTAVSAWHDNADGAAGKYLADVWGKTSVNWFDAPYINTWSNEGDNDGTGFSVPFFEYFTEANQNLAANTFTATMTGMEPGTYEVQIWARVQRRSDADFNADGSKITMNVNGGDAVSIMNSATTVGTGGSTMRIGRYTATGVVGDDGNLALNINVLLGANVHWLCWRDVKYTKVGDPATMTITDAQWATFVAPFDVAIPAGVTAYTVDGVSGTVLGKTEVETTIPANTPVLLNKDVDENDSFSQTFNGVNVDGTPVSGRLTGVFAAGFAPKDSYVLQDGVDGIAFYLVQNADEQPIGANRAYLTVPADVKARSLSFIDADPATGIAAIEALNAGEAEGIYTVGGQKIDQLQKGVNIIQLKGGKTVKVLVK